MDGIGSGTRTEAWVVWHNAGPVLGLVWGFVIWVSREADRRVQDGWGRGWVPVPQTTSPLLDSYWFMLVTPPCGESAPGEQSRVEGGESVHSFVMLPSLEIQQLWRKLFLEE